MPLKQVKSYQTTGLLAAGEALLRALAAAQGGIGCGCGGDYGLCDRCSKADTKADEAAEAWEAAKKAANDPSSATRHTMTDDCNENVEAGLERIRKQASAYRNEDNGDESKWSIYNQGRADALDRMEEDIRRMLSNAEFGNAASGAPGLDGGVQ